MIITFLYILYIIKLAYSSVNDILFFKYNVITVHIVIHSPM